MTDRLVVPNGWFEYESAFFPQGEADEIFRRLTTTLPLATHTVKVFGQARPQPRLTSWHGDPGATYRYSGLTLEPSPWNPDLLHIRQRVSDRVGIDLNSVLVNLYRDGRDSMGWHADNETCFGRDPIIASVTLGASRRFVLRHPSTGQRHEYELGVGSLLIMGPGIQAAWKHCVPRTARAVSARLNLTWRRWLGP